MPHDRPQACHVLSLRPLGRHDSLRRAAARAGARVIALSPWRLELRKDPDTRNRLRAALAAPRIVFTSPTAVRAAMRVTPLRARRGQSWFAVGAGTARALRRAGIAEVTAPARMDSDGLLALPGLHDVRGSAIGLVTAPGGRDRIASTLQRRGARLLRADVYARVPIAPSAAAVARLLSLRQRPWLALSSGEALQRILRVLPEDALRALRKARVAAASQRLADLARAVGFRDVVVADSALPRDLIAAIATAR